MVLILIVSGASVMSVDFKLNTLFCEQIYVVVEKNVHFVYKQITNVRCCMNFDKDIN